MNHLSQWLSQRQLRVLEEAFEGAQAIKALEDQYFAGEKIEHRADQSKTLADYVEGLRDRQLLRVRFNLAQFRLNGFLLNQKSTLHGQVDAPISASIGQLDVSILEKLNFIDAVISKYRSLSEGEELEQMAQTLSMRSPLPPDGLLRGEEPEPRDRSGSETASDEPTRSEPTFRFWRARPGLFRGGLWDIRRELDPNYEQQMIQELRQRRRQDQIALRWLALLLVLPLMVQIFTKTVILSPLFHQYSDRAPTRVELSREIQEHFLEEFVTFKESLEIREILGGHRMTPEEREEVLFDAAEEMWAEARTASLNGVQNLIADGVALVSFGGLVYFNRSKITVIRSFSNRTFLGLSDPVKVFLLILITDMFVGFHSAEGWEVILNGVSQHFGVPENQAAIYAFIATVPVIMDACIKFWIFSYLTSYSPATSAIYERMNT